MNSPKLIARKIIGHAKNRQVLKMKKQNEALINAYVELEGATAWESDYKQREKIKRIMGRIDKLLTDDDWQKWKKLNGGC